MGKEAFEAKLRRHRSVRLVMLPRTSRVAQLNRHHYAPIVSSAIVRSIYEPLNVVHMFTKALKYFEEQHLLATLGRFGCPATGLGIRYEREAGSGTGTNDAENAFRLPGSWIGG